MSGIGYLGLKAIDLRPEGLGVGFRAIGLRACGLLGFWLLDHAACIGSTGRKDFGGVLWLWAFRVWSQGLGFGVQGLGFRVQGFRGLRGLGA